MLLDNGASISCRVGLNSRRHTQRLYILYQLDKFKEKLLLWTDYEVSCAVSTTSRFKNRWKAPSCIFPIRTHTSKRLFVSELFFINKIKVLSPCFFKQEKFLAEFCGANCGLLIEISAELERKMHCTARNVNFKWICSGTELKSRS